jgi:uncharacterized protein (DUF2336 family)
MQVGMRDIQRLVTNRSVDVRADVAGKVASALIAGEFSEKEAQIAQDILHLMVRDVEMGVRLAVAEQLKDSLSAPHDLIVTLAHDRTEVAAPILQYSYVLSEEDLIELVRATHEVAKLAAIARRDSISQPLSGELMATELKEVMRVLMANKGAAVEDAELLKRWEVIAGDSTLAEVLVQRGGLSPAIAEKLYAVVSEEMKPVLARRWRTRANGRRLGW